MKQSKLIGLAFAIIVFSSALGIIVYFDPFQSSTPKKNPDVDYDFTPYQWNYSNPEDEGFDPQTFKTLDNYITNGLKGTKSVVVIRNGNIVFEKYYSGTNTTLHHLFSVTKSITSILVGIAIDKGYIKSINDTVLSFFPNKTFKNVDERKEKMTIFHLLTMTHGVQWEELIYPYGDPRNSFTQMYAQSDWVQWFLDLPMEHEPGTYFEYSTGASHVLSAIIQQATGMKTNKFAEKYLFNPLGINSSEIIWLSDRSGIYEGGRGLYLTTLDMAKIGLLYLNNGRWGDKQIVSKEWVEDSTKNHSPSPNDFYGYQWRIHYNGYSALGYKGQRIYNVPSYNLSFIMTANLNNVYAADPLVNNILIPGIIS